MIAIVPKVLAIPRQAAIIEVWADGRPPKHCRIRDRTTPIGRARVTGTTWRLRGDPP